MSIELLQSMPTSFLEHPLDASQMKGDPFEEFRDRFNLAVQSGVPETNAMVVSTATEEGAVSARVVLLRSLDERGLVFYTNYESRKSQEIGRNPRAHALFYWREIGMQIRIEGTIEKVDEEESRAYFESRHRDSRIGAWASPQSAVIADRESLERAVEEVRSRFGEGEVPLPPFWGGFRILPTSFEFWQGRESRLHDRLRYRKDGDAWVLERLAP